MMTEEDRVGFDFAEGKSLEFYPLVSRSREFCKQRRNSLLLSVSVEFSQYCWTRKIAVDRDTLRKLERRRMQNHLTKRSNYCI